jgi:glycine/sarcosine N-methyltransferase
MPAETVFESFQPYYEIMVDWNQRLSHESSFFQRAFQSVHAKSVLDCACGTGHHACLFARWGMDVSASDISEAMIRKTRHLAATGNLQINVQQASFDNLGDAFGRQFDAVVCVGNSLATAGSRATVAKAVAQMHAATRSDGALILQNLNFERFVPGTAVYGDPVYREHLGQNYLFMKVFRRAGTRCDMDIVVLSDGATGQWTRTVFSDKLLVLDRATIVTMVEEAGFGKIKLYGGHEMTPYEPKTSRDLIVVARRE